MSGGRLWDSGAQAQEFEALAREHPRQPGEGAIAYIERLALLGGALKERMLLAPAAGLRRGSQRKFEREPGEDDA